MNWNDIERQWQTLSRQVGSQWSKLTQEDLRRVAGRRAQLVIELKEHYGILAADAEKQIDKWLAKISPAHRNRSS